MDILGNTERGAISAVSFFFVLFHIYVLSRSVAFPTSMYILPSLFGHGEKVHVHCFKNVTTLQVCMYYNEINVREERRERKKRKKIFF